MTCAMCEASLEEDDYETEGWINHRISTRAKTLVVGQPPYMHTIGRDSAWVCSIECERDFLAALYRAAGGVLRDLEAIDRLILPPGL